MEWFCLPFPFRFVTVLSMSKREWLGSVEAGQWPDPMRGPWAVTFHFASDGERIVTVGFDLRSFSGGDYRPVIGKGGRPLKRAEYRPVKLRPATGDLPEVTSTLLRQLPLEGLRDSARRAARAQAAFAALEAAATDTIRARAEKLAEAYTQERKGSGGRPPLPLSHFEEVARVYRAATSKPTKAVAAHFDRSPATAAKWVMRCRQLELLPPTAKADTKATTERKRK